MSDRSKAPSDGDQTPNHRDQKSRSATPGTDHAKRMLAAAEYSELQRQASSPSRKDTRPPGDLSPLAPLSSPENLASSINLHQRQKRVRNESSDNESNGDQLLTKKTRISDSSSPTERTRTYRLMTSDHTQRDHTPDDSISSKVINKIEELKRLHPDSDDKILYVHIFDSLSQEEKTQLNAELHSQEASSSSPTERTRNTTTSDHTQRDHTPDDSISSKVINKIEELKRLHPDSDDKILYVHIFDSLSQEEKTQLNAELHSQEASSSSPTERTRNTTTSDHTQRDHTPDDSISSKVINKIEELKRLHPDSDDKILYVRIFDSLSQEEKTQLNAELHSQEASSSSPTETDTTSHNTQSDISQASSRQVDVPPPNQNTTTQPRLDKGKNKVSDNISFDFAKLDDTKHKRLAAIMKKIYTFKGEQNARYKTYYEKICRSLDYVFVSNDLKHFRINKTTPWLTGTEHSNNPNEALSQALDHMNNTPISIKLRAIRVASPSHPAKVGQY